MRLINALVILSLVLAAVYVYEIKFQATLQAERVAKLRSEIRRERDAVAALRAEWAKLNNPARIQALAKRYLPLRPIEGTQIDNLDKLPERPPQLVPPDSSDPIGAMIDMSEDLSTGSLSGQR
ncbi:MAG: hypothetical protein AB7K04_11175 [Pseudorhodoplanes sp.]